MKKYCPKCEETKDIQSFHTDKGKSGRLEGIY